MLNARSPILWFSAVVLFVVVLFVARAYLNPNARERRRRRKSHGHVVSRRQGPSVRLLANVDKSKRDRKG